MGNEQQRPFNDPSHPSWYSEPGGPAPQNPYAAQAPQQQAHPGVYPGAYPAAEPKTLSIVALVLGIVGLVTGGFLLLPQIGAIVVGHIALRREPEGRGMAIAGLVLGYLVVVLGLVLLLLLVLFLPVMSAMSGDFT
ncbi:DUF4190 domain-containing protein [Arthrobacter sp. KK5.5]|uniref:DUF4190 domain-containing protein n=1 Tax=Arthrobacter sp. KK5.5 TaxID=3373084 RepID=UPI003EE5306B